MERMKSYTRDEIFEMVEEEDVGFIRLQFTDIFGTFKNVAVTASQLKRALDNQCMFDGSSIEGFARVEDSDMYLYPDLNTFATFPWRPCRFAMVLTTIFAVTILSAAVSASS